MKLINAIVITILATSSVSAFAKEPEPVGEVVTQSADLIFKSPGEISLAITTAKDLKAGKYTDNAWVAGYRVNTNVISRLGVRFTPGSEKVDGVSKIIVKGKNDASHTLSLKLDPTDAFITGKKWIISRDEVMFFDGNIHINGNQIVQPDTYTVSLDASYFIS